MWPWRRGRGCHHPGITFSKAMVSLTPRATIQPAGALFDCGLLGRRAPTSGQPFHIFVGRLWQYSSILFKCVRERPVGEVRHEALSHP